MAVHGHKSKVNITTSHASSGSNSTVTQQANGVEAVDEPGWWTFGRKVWAVVVSLFVAACAIAAIIVIFQ